MMPSLQRYFARKPVEALLEQGHAKIGLKRALGLWDLIFLGVGVILGTGVFVVTGQAASMNAGPAVAVSFAVAGFAAGLAALCYAEMGSMIPVAGSAYTYTYATMGEVVAFAVGWDLILEWCVSGALVAVGWSGYLVSFVESAFGICIPPAWKAAPIAWDATTEQFVRTGCYANAPAVFFVFVIALILVRGVALSSTFNKVAVLAKVLAIGLFLYFGAKAINPENLLPFIPPNEGTFGRFGLSGILQGGSMVYLSFIGFDAVSTAAQEARNPTRDIPFGTLIPVVVCTGIYVLVGIVLTGLVPYGQLGVAHPLAYGIKTTGLLWLELLLAAGAVVGLFACMIGAVLAMPRIFMSMSHDGLLPKPFGRVHPTWGSPYISTIVTAALMSTMAGLLPISVLGEMSSIGTMLAFLLVSVGVMILRLRRPELPRRFKVPGGPWLVPSLSGGISLVLMCSATGHTLARLFAWMALGLLVYWVYGRRHSKLQAARESGVFA